MSDCCTINGSSKSAGLDGIGILLFLSTVAAVVVSLVPLRATIVFTNFQSAIAGDCVVTPLPGGIACAAAFTILSLNCLCQNWGQVQNGAKITYHWYGPNSNSVLGYMLRSLPN